MKRIISHLLLPVTCYLLSVTTVAQSNVTVNVKGLADGTAVTAELGSTFRTEKSIAEATVQNGQFTMTLPIEEPRFVCFSVKGESGYIARLMTDKGESPIVETTVKKEESDRGTWYTSDSQKVYNSPLHGMYVLKITSKRDGLDKAYSAMYDAYRDTDKNNSEGFKALQAGFFADVDKTYKQITADNRDSFWGPFSMLNLYSYLTPDQKPEYDQLSDEAKNSFYGQLLKEQVDPKGFKGEAYSQFDVQDAKGKKTPVAKLVKGKKVFLIDFWASWCGPCRKEIPNLKKIYADYSKKGLEIISVSIDKKDAQWQKALTEEKLPWPNGIDKSGIADQYKVKAIPAIFVVDATTGKIVAENIRGEELEQKVAEMLK